MSFLEIFSKYILPNIECNLQSSDYYTSPLESIGLSSAESIEVKSQLLHLANGPMSLGDIALKDLYSDSIYHSFKEKFAYIVLAETLLRVFPNTAESLNPNFFDGVDDYFRHSSNTHDAKDQIFSHLVFACLAVVWQAFKHESLELPEKSKLNPSLISVLNDSHSALTSDSFDIYQTLYHFSYPSRLVVFLDQNLDKFLNNRSVIKPASCFTLHGLPVNSAVRKKQKLFHSGVYTPYKLVLNTEPWSLFLHNYKQRNTVNFDKPSGYFPFYAKHPTPTLLWSVFLLVDLHEQLSLIEHKKVSLLSEGIMVGDNSSSLGTCNSGIVKVDAKTESPKPCLTVYKKLKYQIVPRLANVTPKISGIHRSNESLVWLSNDAKQELTIKSSPSSKNCTISLSIPESVFDDLPAPTTVINIYVFYYYKNLRYSIPCILTEEYSEVFKSLDRACFTVELDWECINELDFDPLRTPCLSGMSYEKGGADIVVVFG